MPIYDIEFYSGRPFSNGFSAGTGFYTYTGPENRTGSGHITDNGSGTDGLTFTDNDGVTGTFTINGNTSTNVSTEPDTGFVLRDTVTGEIFNMVALDVLSGPAAGTYTLSERPLIPGRSYEAIQYQDDPSSSGAGYRYNEADFSINGGPRNDAISGTSRNDEIFGEGGNDTIDGGSGDDTIDGGIGNDELNGDMGNDYISGGGGADTIFGGESGRSSVGADRLAFEWSEIPDPDNGGQIDNGDALTNGTQTVGGVDVSFSISGNVTYSPGGENSPGDVYTNGIDAGSGTVNGYSAASINSSSVVDLSFSGPVQNVQFRFNDLEISSASINIIAYDEFNNPIAYTVSEGSGVTGSDTDGVSGNDTWNGTNVNADDNTEIGSVLITVPGPVSSIRINSATGNDSLTLTDIYFDDPSTGFSGKGDDRIFGNDGDDTFIAGRGNDTIDGGAGTDTYDADTNPELDDESIAVVLDGNGDGTSTKSNDGTVDDLTSIERIIAGEAASETDVITLTDGVLSTDVSNISDNAVGTFTSEEDGQTYNFGGAGEPTINEILAGMFDPGTGRIWPNGTYQITSGEEDGADVGDIYFENFETANFEVVCFARGTLIRTPSGEVPIERLAAGDRVETLDNGDQPIRWIGKTTVPARGNLAPIRFAPGAIGNDRELRVSPQHRILLTGWQAELYFGQSEVLVPAKALVNEITIDSCPGGTVEYFHILFDRHEIVFSNGAPTESLHPGQVAMNAIGRAARDEVLALFPELSSSTAAHGPIARPALRALEGQLMAREDA